MLIAELKLLKDSLAAVWGRIVINYISQCYVHFIMVRAAWGIYWHQQAVVSVDIYPCWKWRLGIHFKFNTWQACKYRLLLQALCFIAQAGWIRMLKWMGWIKQWVAMPTGHSCGLNIYYHGNFNSIAIICCHENYFDILIHLVWAMKRNNAWWGQYSTTPELAHLLCVST